ncbi:MAG: TonB C-terminal domain-containing protein [Betaproteobacteria bacterium]|nr:TonB C-terminal domain-containing protein [Betaproteobacteria bacterium]
MNARRFIRSFLFALALSSTLTHAADPEADRQQFLTRMRAAIVKNISTPCGVKPKQRIELKVILQDNGYVKAMALVQSSGAAEFDAAIMVAIAGAQPFSLPREPAARKNLQNLNFKFDAFSMPIPECKK